MSEYQTADYRRYWQHTVEGLAKYQGVSEADAVALRTISRKLHRWHELKCGIDAPRGHLQAINRNEDTGQLEWYDGKSWWPYHSADVEAHCRKRLADIMARYPTLAAYVQRDPRGAALYILRPGDVPEGGDASAYYSRGICIY